MASSPKHSMEHHYLERGHVNRNVSVMIGSLTIINAMMISTAIVPCADSSQDIVLRTDHTARFAVGSNVAT